jgi:uncharacterized membrane protein
VQRLLALIIRSFFKGLIILLPLAVTGYIIWAVFNRVDQLVPWVPRGTGFFIVIAGITLIGFAGLKWSFGKVIFDFLGDILAKTPGVRHIYSSVKDILDSFVGDKRKFNRPVWVRTSEAPEMWRIGFLTQRDMTQYGLTDTSAVYLPHSYAISGWVVMVKKENIRPVTTMKPAEAMKFAVSGGITTQDLPKKRLTEMD